MNKKRISVSKKRQITIPIEYFNKIGIEEEVECYMKNNEIIIRPVKNETGGEFAEYILADLVNQGFAGQELVKRFKEMNSQVLPAVDKMIADAKQVAEGKGEYANYDDAFGPED